MLTLSHRKKFVAYCYDTGLQFSWSICPDFSSAALNCATSVMYSKHLRPPYTAIHFMQIIFHVFVPGLSVSESWSVKSHRGRPHSIIHHCVCILWLGHTLCKFRKCPNFCKSESIYHKRLATGYLIMGQEISRPWYSYLRFNPFVTRGHIRPT